MGRGAEQIKWPIHLEVGVLSDLKFVIFMVLTFLLCHSHVVISSNLSKSIIREIRRNKQ